jgi:hypothetical protein
VHPEFEDQRAVIGQRLLEGQNTVQPIVEYRIRVLVVNPVEQ